MTQTTQILIEAGVLLFVMSLLGRIAARFGFSPIPLYLLLGLAFGEGGIVPFDASQEFFHISSEIGVILLLALLGLEYTAAELVTSLKRSRFAGILDFALNALPGAAFALLLGWGPATALALAGVTWISSSGVIAKLLRDLGRVSNRETPTILAVLVIEDLAMAVYLPVLSALVVGLALLQGAISVAVAVGVVAVILYIALRHGNVISKVFNSELAEPLLLGVLGLTMAIAGVAAQLNVSAAVGAFLVGIALSGQVAERAQVVLTPLRDLFAAVFFVFFGITIDARDLFPLLPLALLLAIVTMMGKVLTGYLSARAAGVGVMGRWRAGFMLTPRGEFSIVIASLAVGGGVSTGVAPQLAPLAAAYVLITILAGTFIQRVPETSWFKTAVKQRQASQAKLPAG